MPAARPRSTVLAALVALAALTPASAAPQAGSARLHEAYFLDRELQRPERALVLYREALADPALDGPSKELVRRRIAVLVEDLASADLARLAPPETLVYAELDRPGVHLAGLLEGLDLFAAEGIALPNGQRLLLRRELVEGLLGMRGAALALTRLDPRGERPQGLLAIHPGDDGLARGLLATALAAVGVPVEPIRGRAVVRLEGGYFAASTERLVLVASSKRELTQALRRLDGELEAGLAADEQLAPSLAARRGSLASIVVNGAALAPLVDFALTEAAQRDPQARLVRELLDPRSLDRLGLRLIAGAEGLRLEAELGLRADHRSLGFELLRTARLAPAALAAVPGGSAGYLALGWNEMGSGSGTLPGRRGTALLDLGRELFANLDSLVLFALPTAQGAPLGLPHAALVLAVDDPARSHQVWSTLLGLASVGAGTGNTAAGDPLSLGGLTGSTHRLPDLPPLHLVVGERQLLVSHSTLALEAAAAALAGGATVADDPYLGAATRALAPDTTLALRVHPGRILELLAPHVAPHEARVFVPLAQALAETRAGLEIEQGAGHLALRIWLTGLPRVEGILAALADRRHVENAPPAAPEPPRAVPARAPTGAR